MSVRFGGISRTEEHRQNTNRKRGKHAETARKKELRGRNKKEKGDLSKWRGRENDFEGVKKKKQDEGEG